MARRRLRNTIAGLAVGLILVTTLAIWGGLNAQSAGNSEATAVASLKGAVTAQANAETRRVEAENAKATAVAETKRAEQEARSARRALSGQLAVQAYAALNTEHPQLSLLLAVEALNVTTQKQEPRVPAAEETFRQVLASVGGRILGDPEGAVGAIATSPNSRWVVTAAGPVARLWDLTATVSPAAPRLLLGHKNDITRVVISLDNHWLVTSNTSEPARLWDLNAADPNATSRLLEDSNGPVAISPDSRWLATTSPDKIAHLWDLKSNAVGSKPYILRGLEDGNEITTIGFSPNSYWLVTASGHTGTHYYRNDDTTAQLWDLRSANPSSNPHILRGHTMGITSVAFSYDSHWLVTASGASNTHTGQLDGTPRLWHLNGSDPAADPISLPNNIGPISVVAFSPDGHWLATGNGGESFGLNPSDTTGRVWDLTNAPRIADPIVLTGHTSSMSKISFSSDSRWLVTGDNGAGDRSKDSVRLWDLNYSPPAAQSQVLLGHDPVASQDGNLIVTLSDATAYVWDLTAFETTVAPRIVRGHEGAIKDAAISPDLHWLVTSGADNTARLWNLMTVDSVANPLVLPVAGDRDTGVISSDNHWLVDGVDENIARLWDLTAADPTANPRILRGHEGAVSAIAFSPDQHWLATAGFDGTARLWDLTAADPTANPRILHAGKQALFTLAISLDSHWLVSC